MQKEETPFYQTREFKALQTEWYAKLKEDQFEEIEDWKAPKRFFRGAPDLPPLAGMSLTDLLAQWKKGNAQYREILRQFCYKPGFFRGERHRYIWERYCEGITFKQIIIEVENRFGMKQTVNSIQNFIRRTKMKINRTENLYYKIKTSEVSSRYINKDKQDG